MPPVLHLGIDAHSLQRPGKGGAVFHLHGEPGGVPGQLIPHAGKAAAEPGHPAGCPVILLFSRPQQPIPGRIQAGHHGIGGAGAAVQAGPAADQLRVHSPGKKQGGLTHGGQGLVGGDHHPVRSGKGVDPQKGQVGPMGPVHQQPGPAGVGHLGDGGNIR